jgi:hypothetical protein
MDMAGQHTRLSLIDDINSRFQLGLNDQQKMKFANLGSFGVPRAELRKYLDLSPADRNTYPSSGIPIDTADINKSELADWIHNARLAQFRMKQEGKVKDEYVMIVKADQTTPYPAVQKVINTLTDINVNKFNLITSMEGAAKKE